MAPAGEIFWDFERSGLGKETDGYDICEVVFADFALMRFLCRVERITITAWKLENLLNPYWIAAVLYFTVQNVDFVREHIFVFARARDHPPPSYSRPVSEELFNGF